MDIIPLTVEQPSSLFTVLLPCRDLGRAVKYNWSLRTAPEEHGASMMHVMVIFASILFDHRLIVTTFSF